MSEGQTWLWDAIERSHGGHERRRRLLWRMTQVQAREWEAAYGGKLEQIAEPDMPRGTVVPTYAPSAPRNDELRVISQTTTSNGERR